MRESLKLMNDNKKTDAKKEEPKPQENDTKKEEPKPQET
jgi:hypothetical protein